MKNVAAEKNIERSIPRVLVQPMKTPSQMNAAIPKSGTSDAQNEYPWAAATTVWSSVRSDRKASPPIIYNKNAF